MTVSPSKSVFPVSISKSTHAEGPDVRALVDWLAVRLLGAHVGGSAEDHARLRHRGRRVIVGGIVRRRDCRVADTAGAGSSAFASPKSSTFTVPSSGHLDVGGLQIAMDDPLLVRGFERGGDLPRNRRALRPADSAPSRDAVGEGGAVDQLEDERAHCRPAFFNPIDMRDVWMIERGENLRLAREP